MVIQNALNCLRTASSNLTDSYSLALFSYTFTLAGDQHASDLFKALQGKAIKEGQEPDIFSCFISIFRNCL